MQRGVNDLRNGGRVVTQVSDYGRYLAHVRQVMIWFNLGLARHGVPLRFSDAKITSLNSNDQMDVLDSDGLISQVVAALERGETADGMLHKPQIDTVCELLAVLYRDPLNSVAVLGAMQSGKTGTSNGSEFIAPALYLLTGNRYFAVTLLTNRRGHFNQAMAEFKVFEALYAHLTLVHVNSAKSTNLDDYMRSAPEAYKMTLAKYRNKVMSIATKPLAAEIELDQIAEKMGIYPKEKAPSLQQRSKDRRRINMIHELCRIADGQDFRLMFKIDEVHWGAGVESVRKVNIKDDDGETIEKGYTTAPSVMAEFLKNVRDELATTGRHIFIGYSATPYQIAYLENVNIVRQRLGPGYVGPNFALGAVLDPEQGCRLPDVRKLANEADRAGAPCSFDYDGLVLSYYRNINSFERWKLKSGSYTGDWHRFRAEFEDAMAHVIEQVLLHDREGDPRPVAMCLRAMNDNSEAHAFIAALNLSSEIQIEYYDCSNGRVSQSIKDCVSARMKKKRLLLVVTGSARMADAFPTRHAGNPLRWSYLDLTTNTTMQSSLLQSFYGRACGYGKLIDDETPVVIVSTKNYTNLKRFEEELGAIVMAPAPGAVAVNQRQGRTSVQLPLMLTMQSVAKDRTLAKAFEKLQRRVDKLNLPPKLNGIRAKSIPIWTECFTTDVLSYIERSTKTLFPEFLDDLELLSRTRVSVKLDKRKTGRSSHYYEIDAEGNGIVGFRRVSAAGQKTGGGGDTTIRDVRRALPDNAKGLIAADEMAVRPQIFVHLNDEGRWDVMGVLLRLNKPSRERKAADKSLPTANCIAADLATDDELMTPEVLKANIKINENLVEKGLPPLVPRGFALRNEVFEKPSVSIAVLDVDLTKKTAPRRRRAKVAA